MIILNIHDTLACSRARAHRNISAHAGFDWRPSFINHTIKFDFIMMILIKRANNVGTGGEDAKMRCFIHISVENDGWAWSWSRSNICKTCARDEAKIRIFQSQSKWCDIVDKAEAAVCVGYRINRGKRYEMHSSSRQLTTSVFTVISIMFVLERGRKQFASFNFCFLVIVKMPPPR